MRTFGLILGGGQSSRMGVEKGSLEWNGKTLRERAFETARPFCDEIFISIRREQLTADLQARFRPNDFLFDERAQIGPAAALLAAFAKSPRDEWLVWAIDLPLADRDAIEMLMTSAREEPAAEVVCYRHADGTPEPLFSLWRPSALRRLGDQVERGLTGPQATLRESRVHLIVPSDTDWLFNVNTPEDWERARSVLERRQT